jgi:sRNA-binding carbon storage regulator CsrA
MLILSRALSEALIVENRWTITLSSITGNAIDLLIHDSLAQVDTTVRLRCGDRKEVIPQTSLTCIDLKEDGRVKLGIEVPRSWSIHRKEIFDRLA